MSMKASPAVIREEQDLFGLRAVPVLTRRQKTDLPRGYAGTPGRGPAGETCGSCGYCRSTWSGSGKRYNKCGLVKETRGPATDIRRKSPACQFWQSDLARATYDLKAKL